MFRKKPKPKDTFFEDFEAVVTDRLGAREFNVSITKHGVLITPRLSMFRSVFDDSSVGGLRRAIVAATITEQNRQEEVSNQKDIIAAMES
jgi:hypothetical protein